MCIRDRPVGTIFLSKDFKVTASVIFAHKSNPALPIVLYCGNSKADLLTTLIFITRYSFLKKHKYNSSDRVISYFHGKRDILKNREARTENRDRSHLKNNEISLFANESCLYSLF